jgi:carotenoid cleavage dioxygenase
MSAARFLEGPFAPVREELTAFDLPVTGQLPRELNGLYVRNGPNPIGPQADSYHWFTGAGMVHGVRLREGQAEWYRNRWVRSQAVAEQLGETWVGGPTHGGMDFAANTHVIRQADKLFACVEGGSRPYELTDELGTVGPSDFDGTLPGGYAAHTKLDPDTGERHAIAYFWGWDHVQHVVVGADGRVSRVTDVPIEDGPMMHDFALSESYVVLLDLPVTFSMDLAASGVPLPYTWNPTHQARVGLLPRDGSGETQWIDIDDCFVFHNFNAYEDGGQVVLELCVYERAFDVAQLSGPGPIAFDRWTVDPAAGKVTQERVDDRYQEFPRIDDRLIGRRHRYGYSAVIEGIESTFGFDPGKTGRNAILKHDLANDTAQVHEFRAGAAAAEAVFAPSAPDAAEDDGYLMCFVHDPERDAADLVVIAAQDFTAEPVARVHLPGRVPHGFHGDWFADA